MNKLTQALMEELTVEYVKVGSLQIPESVVISWVIMLLLVVGSILLTRNLKVDHISKRQAALEALYSLGKNFFEGLLGKEGSRYVPYLMTVALYIACSNVIGVFGVKPPTKDLDVTAALALIQHVLDGLEQKLAQQHIQDQDIHHGPQQVQIQLQHSSTPPLLAQEQDDQQCNDETENCGTFCQSSAQQQVRLDLTGSLRLAGDGLRCLTRCNTNANTAANASQRCNASAQSYQTTHSSISFVITVLKFVVYSSPPMLSFMNSAVRNTKT